MRSEAYRSFLDQLATILTSGIPIREALSILERVPTPSIAAAAGRLGDRIAKGDTLGEAMAGARADFPTAHAALVGAAEKAGATGEALRKLRDEVDRRIASRRALLARSAYPLLILVLAALLPPLYLLFEGRIGAYLGLELLIFGVLGALAWLAVRWGRRALPLLLRAPGVGTILRRAAVGESLSLLGLLVGAGIAVREALAIAAGAARLPDLAAELRDAASDLQRGKNLSQALERVEGIPLAERGIIATGERAGAMDSALEKTGRAIEESAFRAGERALRVLPVLLYAVAGIVVVAVYVKALLGYFSRLGTLAVLGSLVLALPAPGCYEIEPELPRGYVGSKATAGWPPPAVYARDPFHPANRLFHRLFVLGVERSPGGDVPVSPRESLMPVDRAEVLGLLEELERGEKSLATVIPPARPLMQSDLLAILGRLRVDGKPEPKKGAELREELARAALALAAPVESGAGGAGGGAGKKAADRVTEIGAEKEGESLPLELPPPLREAAWTEAPGPRAAGLRPSPSDLRWTRIFHRPDEALLLRLRTGADRDGEPALLPIGSEAWLLKKGKEGRPVPRVFRLLRSRIVSGEEPWEEVSPEAVFQIRDPEDPRRPPRQGDLRALCSGCHPGPGLEAAPGRSEAGPPATLDDQREDARKALRSLLRG